MAGDGEQRRTLRLTDPRALRAVAHPLRLALIGQLRLRGPLTATQASELVGASPSSCSFHLRQLAKYGLVEEAGGGRGREKPWRATAMSTSWPSTPDNPEAALATQVLNTAVAERYHAVMREWIAASGDEPAAWREATQFGDSLLYLTADELAELGRETQALLERYALRMAHPETRPAGARPVTWLHIAVPTDRPADV
jgi:predicted ArsR family transcriptional regulator